MKYVFTAKICLVKTSTRLKKYESRVIKSNPDYFEDCASETKFKIEDFCYLPDLKRVESNHCHNSYKANIFLFSIHYFGSTHLLMYKKPI